MVSPHRDWTDTTVGYEYNGILVKVLPSYIESWETGKYAKDGVDRDNANAFSVHYDEGAYGVEGQLVAFSDERPAWEFANLFTAIQRIDMNPRLRQIPDLHIVSSLRRTPMNHKASGPHPLSLRILVSVRC